MKRLEQITKSNELSGKKIIITGCGYRPLQTTFYDLIINKPTHNSIKVNGIEMKVNIGAAIAGVLACHGAAVHLVSRTEEKLQNIKRALSEIIESDLIEYSAIDLIDENKVEEFVNNFPKDKPVYWIQSIGLGAGAYKIKDNNPYLHIEDIPTELLEKESNLVLKGTHILMQKLLPIFREQNKKFNTETRIAIISSMSAIRGYNRGATHCAAKGAISRYTNSAMLDLWKEKIYITDVRPGAVDTGMYDNKTVQKAVLDVDKEYGGYYNKKGIRLMPPTSIGEVIKTIFTTPAHITSVNMVAQGQFPNEGS